VSAESFVLRLGHALHQAGFPAHQLEDTLLRASARLGLVGQFFSMPTGLFASFGEGEQHRTYQIRVEPGVVDIGRLARLDEVVRQVDEGALEPEEGVLRVAAITASASGYGRALTVAGFVLASASTARIFGGGLREVAAAGLLGLVIGLLAALSSARPPLRRVFETVASAVAAALATALAHVFPLSVYTATVAGLIVLIPGFSLTVAMIELATRHLVSGTARLAGALVTFLAMAFGVALGTRLAEAGLGAPAAAAPRALPPWTYAIALLASSLGLTVILRARPRDVPVIGLAGALAFGGARLGTEVLGPELGAFVGALVLGMASNAYARLARVVELVALVPGMLLLVPGSLGFQSLSSLLRQDTLLGLETAVRVAVVAISIAAGILVSTVIVPPRRIPR
jgi:uncharacterized membrane protein YjjP (DUF1212 family)